MRYAMKNAAGLFLLLVTVTAVARPGVKALITFANGELFIPE